MDSASPTSVGSARSLNGGKQSPANTFTLVTFNAEFGTVGPAGSVSRRLPHHPPAAGYGHA